MHCAKSSFILNDVQDLFIECPSVDQKLWQISLFLHKGSGNVLNEVGIDTYSV